MFDFSDFIRLSSKPFDKYTDEEKEGIIDLLQCLYFDKALDCIGHPDDNMVVSFGDDGLVYKDVATGEEDRVSLSEILCEFGDDGHESEFPASCPVGNSPEEDSKSLISAGFILDGSTSVYVFGKSYNCSVYRHKLGAYAVCCYGENGYRSCKLFAKLKSKYDYDVPTCGWDMGDYYDEWVCRDLSCLYLYDLRYLYSVFDVDTCSILSEVDDKRVLSLLSPINITCDDITSELPETKGRLVPSLVRMCDDFNAYLGSLVLSGVYDSIVYDVCMAGLLDNNDLYSQYVELYVTIESENSNY